MKFNLGNEYKKINIGFVYDIPEKLKNFEYMVFPPDAREEWESEKTIETIIATWESLGFTVIHFPLDSDFLKNWAKNISKCSLVHSVAEGWGSLAREAWIPALSELSGIPIIGSGPFTQSLCMSKTLTKLTARFLKIPTAPFYLIKNKSDLSKVPTKFLHETHFIKPDAEGSGMGIDESHSISQSKKQTQNVVHALLEKYPNGILLEKYLSGSEYTSALIGSPACSLPVAHIEVESGIYGHKNKSKECMNEKVTFPRLPKQTENMIQKSTEKLFHFLEMHDFVRMDWKCDEKGRAFFMEANPLAGLSYHYSLLPLMAKEKGISYQHLFSLLAQSALLRSNNRNLWYGKTRIN